MPTSFFLLASARRRSGWGVWPVEDRLNHSCFLEPQDVHKCCYEILIGEGRAGSMKHKGVKEKRSDYSADSYLAPYIDGRAEGLNTENFATHLRFRESFRWECTPQRALYSDQFHALLSEPFRPCLRILLLVYKAGIRVPSP